jgi:hypothetical protein
MRAACVPWKPLHEPLDYSKAVTLSQSWNSYCASWLNERCGHEECFPPIVALRPEFRPKHSDTSNRVLRSGQALNFQNWAHQRATDKPAMNPFSARRDSEARDVDKLQARGDAGRADLGFEPPNHLSRLVLQVR